MQPLLRLCDSCQHFIEDAGTCKAFPSGVPLGSEDTHFEPIEGQVGDTVYEMDMRRYDRFEDWRRVHPNIKMPVIVSAEVPDEDTELAPQEVPVEKDNENGR